MKDRNRTTAKKSEVVSTGKSVVETAKDRYRMLYDRFDTVVVATSGGKDSCVALELAVEVARERDRLPVHAMFFDEEVIYRETDEYIRRINGRDDVDLFWFALPNRYRNACSRKHPFFYPWHPDERDLWVRPLPDEAITEHPRWEWGDMTWDVVEKTFPPSKWGNVVHCSGVRAQESIMRYRVVANMRREAWVNKHPVGPWKNIRKACPIYDFETEDIWRAIHEHGWDYNRAYDKMNRLGFSFHQDQRIGPPFVEENIDLLRRFHDMEPELWDRVCQRVHGVRTAYRYGDTKLYRPSAVDERKPDNMTWRQFVLMELDRWAPELRSNILQLLSAAIEKHRDMTDRPIPEEKPDWLTGASWRFFAICVAKGDVVGRQFSAMVDIAEKRRGELGITFEEAMQREREERYHCD